MLGASRGEDETGRVAKYDFMTHRKREISAAAT